MFMPNYVVQYLGNEILLKIFVQEPNGNKEEFAARFPANPGILDSVLLDRIRVYLLGKLERIMSS
jgi:hypothetical protein